MNSLSRSFALTAAISLAIIGFAGTTSSTAQAYDTASTSAINVAEDAVILKGYDAVAYFTTGTPTAGNAKFSAVHGGATYQFASAANLQAFQANPAKYVPQYGGFCAMGAALGKKLDFASNWVLGMLADEKGTPITPEVFKEKFTAELLPSGLYTSKEDQAEIGAMYAQMGPDPRRNAEVLKAFVQRAKPTTMAIELTRGPITMQETGPAIVPTRVNPNTMEVQTGTPIMKGLTPESSAELVEVIDPVTQERYKVTKGSLLAPGGDLAGGGRVQTSLAPGVAEGATGAAAKAVEQLANLRSAAEAVPENKASLSTLRDTLQSFKPGPKANWSYLTGALATQLGVARPQDVEGVAGQEEFNKLATQFINRQLGNIGGGGTDAKLESAAKGSPNDLMSKVGIENVTALMLGLEDATAAKNAAWERYSAAGNGPQTYPKFVEQFNRIYNPRVFQSQYMSDSQKAMMLKGMSDKEKAQFDKDWKTAFKAGWIK